MITLKLCERHTTNGCIPRRNDPILETRQYQMRDIAIKTLICWFHVMSFPHHNMIVPAPIHILNKGTVDLHVLELLIPVGLSCYRRSLLWSSIEGNMA